MRVKFSLLSVCLIIFSLAIISIVSAACPSGMVSYWKFENNGQDSADGNTGNIVNNARYVSSGKLGMALNTTTASTDYFNVSGANQNLKPDDKFTIEAWINPTAYSSSKTFILGKGRSGYPYQSYLIYLDNGKIGFYYHGIIIISSNWQVPKNSWTYITITRDSNNYKLYINSIVNLTATNSANATYDNNPFVIGSAVPSFDTLWWGNTNNFQGKIDEVAIYNRALTQADISEHWNSGNGKELCIQEIECFNDADGDRWGNGTKIIAETCASGYNKSSELINLTGDCNNADRNVYPGAAENCLTPYDDNCNNQNNENCAGITGAYWTNMNDEQIIQANKNDKVKMSISGGGINGMNVIYRIFKAGQSGIFRTQNDTALLASSGFSAWRNAESGTYLFNASLDSQTWMNSSSLTINNIENNSAPYAEILNPKDKQIYFLGENLSFIQNSYDIDDDFTYTWILGDGTTLSGNSINKNNYNFSHIYSTKGQKNIILRISDDRGINITKRISILIINSTKESFAYIDKPEWGKRITGRFVDYNASSSYAVNSTINSTGGYKLECLAGMCPSQTEGCPLPQTGCKIPIEGGIKDYSKLVFLWEFLDKGTNKTSAGNSGVSFTEPYFASGNHQVRLTVAV